MRLKAMTRIAVLIALLGGSGIAAGRDTVQIIIEGGGLSKPIVITDPALVSRFRVGTGPGTYELLPDGARITNDAPSFIIDWERGAVNAPTVARKYQVSFVTGRPDGGIYTVFYSIDPTTQHGYVYLPGRGDPQYAANVRLILRKVEGSWFSAWSSWEQVANPLITAASAGQ